MTRTTRQLILASGSTTRRAMLAAAGVMFDVVPADVDEPALRSALATENPDVTPAEIAQALAAAKSKDVSRRYPGAIVIGSDQILECDGEIFSKPGDASAVRTTLEKLSDRTHSLHAAVALSCAGKVSWAACDTARLTMRCLSPAFIDDYVARTGEAVLGSVGAYQIEGLGIQLFEQIDGNHFTILGMPLLPLLSELRAQGELPQ
ncbi:MAG: Maf family protein [Hyphomicrobiaceae bacterium]|nr:Maf family protein [Hyphomicrobiaceae bacterium]